MVKTMNFEDALRKVISESKDTQSTLSERSSYPYSYLSEFLRRERKLDLQRLYDALNEFDQQKWRSLIAKD